MGGRQHLLLSLVVIPGGAMSGAGQTLMRSSPMRYMQVSVPQDNDIRGKVALGPLQALASKENDLLRGTGDWHNIQVRVR